MMRYTHPNPLRNETESRQRRGARDLADLVSEAMTGGISIHTVTPEEVAERNRKRNTEGFAIRSAHSKRAGKASARSTSSRAQAWKNGVPLP